MGRFLPTDSAFFRPQFKTCVSGLFWPVGFNSDCIFFRQFCDPSFPGCFGRFLKNPKYIRVHFSGQMLIFSSRISKSAFPGCFGRLDVKSKKWGFCRIPKPAFPGCTGRLPVECDSVDSVAGLTAPVPRSCLFRLRRPVLSACPSMAGCRSRPPGGRIPVPLAFHSR